MSFYLDHLSSTVIFSNFRGNRAQEKNVYAVFFLYREKINDYALTFIFLMIFPLRV